MDVQHLLDTVHELSDLELAILLDLIARSHCLISCDDGLIDDLADELVLIVSERFGLTHAVLEPEDSQDLERFNEAILEDENLRSVTSYDDYYSGSLRARLASIDIRAAPKGDGQDAHNDNRMVRNVIIAKDFNLACTQVQVQMIELIENRRMLLHTTVHVAPKTFLFLPLVRSSERHIRLTPHLNDRVLFSHTHNLQDGFPNLEELDEISVSMSHRDAASNFEKPDRRVTRDQIDSLRSKAESVTFIPEVRRYMQDVVTFLRMERTVDGGITPRATNDFVWLTKCLTSLHGIDFITPSLAILAARKVYPHRLVIAEPRRERSMQYGSKLADVERLFVGLTPERVIDHIIQIVPCPV